MLILNLGGYYWDCRRWCVGHRIVAKPSELSVPPLSLMIIDLLDLLDSLLLRHEDLVSHVSDSPKRKKSGPESPCR
jgi:hypothetical protein